MAMSKSSKAKSGLAAAQKVSGGPSGKMQKMSPVKAQKPGGRVVSNSPAAKGGRGR